MKKFKEIDVWMNILLFVITIMAAFASLEVAFCIGYFGVGAWQLISMLTHTFLGDSLHLSNNRTFYHLVVLCIVLLTAVSFMFQPLAIVMAFGMLFAGPIMAIVYFNMCYNETYYYNVRPLSVLK